jgi:hypothetical protein
MGAVLPRAAERQTCPVSPAARDGTALGRLAGRPAVDTGLHPRREWKDQRVSVPDCIDVARHQELRGRSWHVAVRRTLIGLLLLVPVLALVNLFGQRPRTDTASSAAAELEVYAPARLRGGLLYMGRFTIVARQTLRRPALVLDPGWAEGMQINTVTPAPTAEESRDGKLVYRYDTIHAGEKVAVYAQFQVNPTNVGRRSQSVALEAAGVAPLVVERTVTLLP